MRSEAIFAILAFLLLVAGVLSSRSSEVPPSDQWVSNGGPQYDPADDRFDVELWDVPLELRYPGWTQKWPENKRIFIVTDSVKAVAAWYLEHLENSEEGKRSNQRRVIIGNKEIEIDIESVGNKTQIALTPLMPNAGH